MSRRSSPLDFRTGLRAGGPRLVRRGPAADAARGPRERHCLQRRYRNTARGVRRGGALRGRVARCVEINQCVGCAVRNQHRHAIEQASRRWRGGQRDDSARTRRKILMSTQVARETAGPGRLPPAAVPGRRGVRAGAAGQREAAHALRARFGFEFLAPAGARRALGGEGGPAGPKTG